MAASNSTHPSKSRRARKTKTKMKKDRLYGVTGARPLLFQCNDQHFVRLGRAFSADLQTLHAAEDRAFFQGAGQKVTYAIAVSVLSSIPPLMSLILRRPSLRVSGPTRQSKRTADTSRRVKATCTLRASASFAMQPKWSKASSRYVTPPLSTDPSKLVVDRVLFFALRCMQTFTRTPPSATGPPSLRSRTLVWSSCARSPKHPFKSSSGTARHCPPLLSLNRGV